MKFLKRKVLMNELNQRFSSTQSRPPWMNSGPSENRNFHNMHGGPGGHGGHHNFPPPMPNMGAPPMPPNPNGMPPPWMQPPPPPMGQGPAPPGHPMGEFTLRCVPSYLDTH